jgi:hypothetical protein
MVNTHSCVAGVFKKEVKGLCGGIFIYSSGYYIIDAAHPSLCQLPSLSYPANFTYKCFSYLKDYHEASLSC